MVKRGGESSSRHLQEQGWVLKGWTMESWEPQIKRILQAVASSLSASRVWAGQLSCQQSAQSQAESPSHQVQLPEERISVLLFPVIHDGESSWLLFLCLVSLVAVFCLNIQHFQLGFLFQVLFIFSSEIFPLFQFYFIIYTITDDINFLKSCNCSWCPKHKILYFAELSLGQFWNQMMENIHLSLEVRSLWKKFFSANHQLFENLPNIFIGLRDF